MQQASFIEMKSQPDQRSQFNGSNESTMTVAQDQMPESLKTRDGEGDYVTLSVYKIFARTPGPKSVDGRDVLIEREEKR